MVRSRLEAAAGSDVELIYLAGSSRAMQGLLSGDVELGKNRLTFASDFTMPAMPKIE